MKLITSKLRKLFEKYSLYSQDSKLENSVVLCKFFLPEGDFTWYVTEANKVETSECKEDYKFFGLVNINGESEYGYFYLSELQTLRTKMFKLPIERDMFFDEGKITIKEIKK